MQKNNIYKNMIIRNGQTAVFNERNNSRAVTICNVKREKLKVYFNLRDIHSNSILKKNGLPIIWDAEYAINNNAVVIDNPEYVEYEPKQGAIEVDVLKQQREDLNKFFINNVKFDKIPFKLDKEQLNSILSTNNTLITARAGSGKTRVLVAKMIDLFENHNLNDNNVLAFCFNTDASEEISARLNNKCKIKGELKYQNYKVAHTFHSFAKNSINVKGEILTDRVRLIKKIINELKRTDEDFAYNVYKFFKVETIRVDSKIFNNIDDYYKYIKNSKYLTLNNEKVKSRCEKLIADYLFEHDIEYIYEKSFYPYKIDFENASLSKDEISRCIDFIGGRKETVPDFYFPKYNIIWEHWAIDGNENEEEIEDFNKSVTDYKEYLQNKEWKQKFWSKSWRTKLSNENRYNNELKAVTKMIETTNRGLDLKSREDVESKICEILKQNGIYKERLPQRVLIERVWAKCIDNFTKLIDQFINKLQQNYFDCIDNFVKNIEMVEDEKTKIYYKLGYRIYQEYIKVLDCDKNNFYYSEFDRYCVDFNQILYNCSKAVLNGNLDDRIKQIKWILIDEYQDFSRLFDYLINSILQRNPDIKVFCVGDDWQAINRFAGSNLEYFDTFANRYKDSNLCNISTNYRSENHIVQFANNFMNKYKFDGQKPKSNIMPMGVCVQVDITNSYIGKFDDENPFFKYLDYHENKKPQKAKYLKHCFDIIKAHKDSKIMILNRSNLILGKEIEEFNDLLRKLCTEFMTIEDYDRKVVLKTVHKSKGEEADVVILLNINEGYFPVFNPNNNLFELFGESVFDSIKDEQRLYYVALTRAKHNLYILYEDKIRSEYILK